MRSQVVCAPVEKVAVVNAQHITQFECDHITQLECDHSASHASNPAPELRVSWCVHLLALATHSSFPWWSQHRTPVFQRSRAITACTSLLT
eukprot:364358-Chlamydomonas_euryale.AAC.1